MMLLTQSSATATAAEEGFSPKVFKTEFGVRVEEFVAGSGARPKPGDRVLLDYVLRRPNGYFIYSTREGVSFQPKDIPVGPVALVVPDPGAAQQPGELVPGLAETLLQMKQGGKVRAFIPPTAGYKDCEVDLPQPPTYATKRQLCNHYREPLVFELALLRVLPQGQ